MKKILTTLILALMMLIVSGMPAFAGSWEWVEDHWRYRDNSGKFKNNEWFKDENGYTYHFDTFGNMDTGLKYIGNNWYHFADDGALYYDGYDEATGTVSVEDGKAYHSTDSGLLIAQMTAYDDVNYNYVILALTNFRNVPISFDGYVDISGGGVYEKWYSVTDDSDYMGSSVIINPMEIKSILLMSPDAHALNFKKAEMKITAHYTLNGSPYYVWTKAQPVSLEKHDVYYTHLD